MPKFENSQSDVDAERGSGEDEKYNHEKWIEKDKRTRREFIILKERGTDDLESWMKLKKEVILFDDEIKDPELKEELQKNKGSYRLSYGNDSPAWIRGDLKYVDRNGNVVLVILDLKEIVEFVESGLLPSEQWKKVEDKLHE